MILRKWKPKKIWWKCLIYGQFYWGSINLVCSLWVYKNLTIKYWKKPTFFKVSKKPNFSNLRTRLSNKRFEQTSKSDNIPASRSILPSFTIKCVNVHKNLISVYNINFEFCREIAVRLKITNNFFRIALHCVLCGIVNQLKLLKIYISSTLWIKK